MISPHPGSLIQGEKLYFSAVILTIELTVTMNLTLEGKYASESANDIRPAFQRNDSLLNAARYNAIGPAITKLFSRKNYYKIWLTHSNCTIHFSDRTLHICAPALIFSNPVVPYAVEGLGTHRSGYWCIFKEEFLRTNDRVRSIQESPLFNYNVPNAFMLNPQQLSAATILFDDIIAAMASDYKYKYEEIRSYINLLIHQGLKAQPVTDQPSSTGSLRLTSLFTELLEQQFPIKDIHESLQLKAPGDFASHLGIHVNHLNHAVKTATGKTTRDHIAEKVLYEAKGLLRHTDWDIAEIAYALGFSYSNHLNNFFKRHTGITPTMFRLDI
jgi:AraC-like DNA-binding protein